MHRAAIEYLEQNWFTSTQRKPLIIRGARQVGKTWLVRHFASVMKKQLIELNFEKNPQLRSLFESNDPNQVLINLSAELNQKVDVQNCILFLDEIQAAPELLHKLRWFAEDLSELPVVAAGSLLEFTLEDHTFSMPVGRINYLHLEPLSFEEFLHAQDKLLLCEYLKEFKFESSIPLSIHEQLLYLFKEYIMIGGMPAAVSSWIAEKSWPRINQIHNDLLATYREDFAKYSGRILAGKLNEVMVCVPQRLGQKFVYSKVSPTLSTPTIKHILSLLNKARICHRVVGCAANGVPLAAQIQEKYTKEIFIDTGLCSAALGLNLNQINTMDEITLINKGGITEQVVGQLLRTIDPFYLEPCLYYWHRDTEGSNAEVDYVIQHGSQVIPIEVKAGSTGSLKSLHLFMGLKTFDTAIRINLDIPTTTNIEVKNNLGNDITYTLLSIPIYLTGQIHRLLKSL